MLDFVGVIHVGGLIVYQKYCVPQAERPKISKELRKFIEDVFLAQKKECNKKLGNHIFEHRLDRDKGLLYVIVYLEQFANPKNSDLLDLFVNLFNKKYYARHVVKEGGDVIGLLDCAEELNKDFNILLDTIDFSSSEQINETTKKTLTKKFRAKPEEPTKGKERTWDPLMSSSTKNKKKIEESMNYAQKENEEDKLESFKNKYMGDAEDDRNDSFAVISSDEEAEETVAQSVFGRLKSSLTSVAKGGNIKEADIDKLLKGFADELYEKNVAMEISQEICDSLKHKLLREKAHILQSTKTIVRQALKDAIAKILTPKVPIDLLSMALKKKEEGRPFVVAFIGVNGVGKSTNLAKVAYMFKNNGFSVMLAACDNFRAGAVEQIKTHGRCLEVPVFERGYKDDSANIAKDAIAEANAKKIDVVLIDTAGRMQDNEPLMKSLARLVNINSPDVVLFICEALAGGDLIDQVTKFNRSLKEMSSNLLKGSNAAPEGDGREIDGILLSKFDTVDDKVGAALSLTYSTGKPIVFVGTGQKYQNLRKINVDAIVKSLLK